MSLIRRTELLRKLKISNSSLYYWLKSGHFPKPIPLGPRMIAWRTEDVDKWIDERAKRAQAFDQGKSIAS